MSVPTILMVAGEASADRHAADVIRAVRDVMPSVKFIGMGGPEMEKAGMECVYGMDELSVMGFTDVLPRILRILKVYSGIKNLMDSRRPSLFIPVDLPDFNMRLARYAGSSGLKVLYYIAPQAWAWRRYRARTLARTTDALAVIFPFEEEFFSSYGVHARYVGHPFLDAGRPDVSGTVSWPPRRIGMMPGSRRHEIETILPVMMEAKRLVAHRHPGLTWHLPVARGLDEQLIRRYTDRDVRLEDTLPEVDLAMVKSGTSSLEMALRGVPEVICYRTSTVNYLLARTFVKIHHIGMPNIIMGRTIVPELIQHRLTGDDLAKALLTYLEDRSLFEATRRAYVEMRGILGGKRASVEVARWVRELLEAA
ncbi:MAG TPA: lipid-A-disaccharide synthase [Deltaproteobacteria bacterium]|nr:lipid-A-disaccharide synthase [Deltaproteobacteria bacterium]HPR55108.1 lipid-A-disaccharide synthase [Deltaproteobacteria bacterium]HXK47310.1 lipid-A-disaccharide synthase [Deltaproteobacteria bacterium]